MFSSLFTVPYFSRKISAVPMHFGNVSGTNDNSLGPRDPKRLDNLAARENEASELGHAKL